MISNVELRRKPGGEAVFVPPSHVVTDLSAYEVAEIPDDTTARRFVEAFHYSASFPAARERGGLYHCGQLVGVAVASYPMNDAVLSVLPCDRLEGAELGRLVLKFEGASPFNLASWFVSRWTEILKRKGYKGLVSFADPVPRLDAKGTKVFKGHVGTLYSALSAPFLGRTDKRTLRLLPDGTVLSARALSKIRSRDQGWRYSVDMLVKHGATPPANGEDLRLWLARELPRVTRTLRHGGNLRYCLPLDSALRRSVEKAVEKTGRSPRKYPKFDLAGGLVMPEGT